MLPRRELNVGKSYVNENEWIVREVVGIGRMNVKYKAYDLNTGKFHGSPRVCQKKTFIHWADREATHEETKNLHHDEAHALYETRDPIQDKEADLSLEQIQLMARSGMTNH